MYPYLRVAKEFFVFRKAPELSFGDTHVSHHRVWPWDIDPFMELNNGRTLTLFDLGRLLLGKRAGLLRVLRQEKWSMTMAGVCVRYRRRLRSFERFEMRSRAIGWDARFIYLDQTMWKLDGECANQAIYRVAITDKNGIVATDRLLKAMGVAPEAMQLPAWVQTWLDAEAQRPWPPEHSLDPMPRQYANAG